jgi:hypothetical protein
MVVELVLESNDVHVDRQTIFPQQVTLSRYPQTLKQNPAE